MSDLAVIDPAVALERAADPGEFVVMALERGRSWLAEALAHGDLEALVNAKGYAATLRVAVMQKQLGHDAELSATELVRRAERCIVQGVDRSREAGELLRHGQTLRRPGHHVADNDMVRSLADVGIDRDDLADIRPLADDVTDDEFEEAIADSKAEGNLSRASLLRKVNPLRAPKLKPSDRSEWNRGRRRINPERIVEQTVIALEGLTLGLNMISVEDISALDAEKRLIWSQALAEPLTAINRLKKGLNG